MKRREYIINGTLYLGNDMKPLKVIYSINIEDVQTVAEEELGRKLNRNELKIVEDKIGDYIDWHEAITLALNEAVKLQKKSKTLAKAQI